MKNFPFGNLFLRIEEQKTKSQKKKTSKNFPATRNFEMEVVPATKEVRTHCEPM